MKKSILGLMLGAVAFGLQAQNFVARDFLQGNQAVFITNNTTYTYGQALIPYTNAMGATVASASARYTTTNGVLSVTYYTNSYIEYPYAWNDVLSGSDRDGNNMSGAVAISLIGTTASTTGAMTFTFSKLLNMSSPSVPSTPATETDNIFVIAVTPNGTTRVSLSTNLPSAKVQGAAGWRLVSVVEPNNAAAGGVMLQQCTLNMWQP